MVSTFLNIEIDSPGICPCEGLRVDLRSAFVDLEKGNAEQVNKEGGGEDNVE